MEESQSPQEPENVSPIYEHLFGLMIIFSIAITVVLVSTSMALYYSSGAAQLDLSRPGYDDVRNQIDKSDDFNDYSSTGSLNSGAVAEFKILFDEKVKKIKSVDSFGGDPLSPDALGMVTAEVIE